jgi:hypothetical protein
MSSTMRTGAPLPRRMIWVESDMGEGLAMVK